jgi:carboxymethylenebutenolidase
MSMVQIDGSEGRVPAYLAVPAADPPWRGVVIIHDALGMTVNVRSRLHR